MGPVRILCIETALSGCSVCLTEDEQVLAQSISDIPNSASDKLPGLVADVLEHASKHFSDIHAIAVSNGPGSYTGLRIGVAASKGYAYSLNIPLLAISTLQIMAAAAKNRHGIVADRYVPAIDARRDEIFWSMFDHNLDPLIPEAALIVDETAKIHFDTGQKICLIGNGAPKLYDAVQLPGLELAPNLDLQAQDMKTLVFAGFLKLNFSDPAYLEPNYTKDFFTSKRI